MQQLINDLLALSRVGNQGQDEDVDCDQITEEILRDLELSIRECHAEVTHDHLPTVHAHPRQLEQLLQNLVTNAIKFSNGNQPHVHIGCKQLPGFWEFSVQDNGIGIEPRYFERIFNIFQRLHSRDEYPGTGIGLAICKKIVERHGGKIWVDSVPGEGSTFHFTLPSLG
jgi:light-regulated signal transduction histidine kinase (bacteriophytochrome)